ncbi:hypothetical protein SLEP1_g51289 [Rubroshorea leprosula]|uniref:Uncharacterized protein n=1 Tax=Rubroshorea leprosula TaxID=152421 RepID=A0AAV5M5Y8_9ROSI|nr:hypothetical protein SLEP1_g51289 [Rubroshorea leprosula]
MADKGRKDGGKMKGEEGRRRRRDKWSEVEEQAEDVRKERKKKEKQIEELKEAIKNLRAQEHKLRDKVQRLKDEEDRKLGRMVRKLFPNWITKLMQGR